MPQVRERDSKSQQLLLTDMFKGAAAATDNKAPSAEAEDPAAAAGDEKGGRGSNSEGDDDSDAPCAAPRQPKDMEDLFSSSKGPDQAKTAAVGRRGRAHVTLADNENDDEEGQACTAAAAGVEAAGDDMQGDQAAHQHRQQRKRQQQGEQVMPDRLKDYGAWLAWQKQTWRAGRQERKRRKVEAGRRHQASNEQQAPQVCPGPVHARV